MSTINKVSVFERLRFLGLECNCVDCDVFGCDNCTLCGMSEETALSLEKSIMKLEHEFNIKITRISNDGGI